MLHIFLGVVFVLHAAVFGRLYFIRRRHTHRLAFSLGFILLAIYHGHSGWSPGDDGPLWGWIHWMGVGLCAVATPALVSSLVRRLRAGLRVGND